MPHSEKYTYLGQTSKASDNHFPWVVKSSRLWLVTSDLIWPQARVWGGEVHWEALGARVEAVCLAPLASALVSGLGVEILVPVSPLRLRGPVQPRPGLGAAVEAGRVIAGGCGGEPRRQGQVLRWNRNRSLDLGDISPISTCSNPSWSETLHRFLLMD